jgi:hypothetical protein
MHPDMPVDDPCSWVYDVAIAKFSGTAPQGIILKIILLKVKIGLKRGSSAFIKLIKLRLLSNKSLKRCRISTQLHMVSSKHLLIPIHSSCFCQKNPERRMK